MSKKQNHDHEECFYVFENKKKPGVYICDEKYINTLELADTQKLDEVSGTPSPIFYVTTNNLDEAKRIDNKVKAFFYSLNLSFDYKVKKIYRIPEYVV